MLCKVIRGGHQIEPKKKIESQREAKKPSHEAGLPAFNRLNKCVQMPPRLANGSSDPARGRSQLALHAQPSGIDHTATRGPLGL